MRHFWFTYGSIVLPVTFGLVGGIAKLLSKSPPTYVIIAVIVGALLGWLTYIISTVIATLFNQLPAKSLLSQKQIALLEQDKHRILRAIKEIEFDLALERITEDDAARLTQPLKERALRLLEAIDRARVSLSEPRTSQSTESSSSTQGISS